VSVYVPGRGDLVWLCFDPQAGHEQASWRPALVVSPLAYNAKVKLALVCPITSRAKGYPFEVPLPSGLPIAGAVLADQLKSLDWVARQATYKGAVPPATLREVLARIAPLLQ
jgi:mRNA interferase MazF